MANAQERQLLLTEAMMKKLDEVITRQGKLEELNEKLRKDNEELRAAVNFSTPRRTKTSRRRSRVSIPDDLPKRFRKVYNLLSKGGHITEFLVDESPDSESNQHILETIKKELKKENGGDNCTWTDIQIEAQFKQYFKSRRDQEVRKRKGTNAQHKLNAKRTRRINAKYERRLSGFENLRNTLEDESVKMIEEIMEPAFMSSEESDIEEDEEGKRKTVRYVVRPLKWERTKLTGLKEQLDKAYEEGLSPHAKGLKKPRCEGEFSQRSRPMGPSWAVRMQ